MREKQRYQEKMKREKQKAAKAKKSQDREKDPAEFKDTTSKTKSTLLAIIEKIKRSEEGDKEKGGYNPFSYENFVKNS